MNKIIRKSVALSILLTTCVLPVASRADRDRGHQPASGVVGQAFVLGFWDGLNGSPPDPEPIQTRVTVYSLPPVHKKDIFGITSKDKWKHVADIKTDEDGCFTLNLKPGRYMIEPNPLPGLWAGGSAFVEVEKREYAEVNVYYDVMMH